MRRSERGLRRECLTALLSILILGCARRSGEATCSFSLLHLLTRCILVSRLWFDVKVPISTAVDTVRLNIGISYVHRFRFCQVEGWSQTSAFEELFQVEKLNSHGETIIQDSSRKRTLSHFSQFRNRIKTERPRISDNLRERRTGTQFSRGSLSNRRNLW